MFLLITNDTFLSKGLNDAHLKLLKPVIDQFNELSLGSISMLSYNDNEEYNVILLFKAFNCNSGGKKAGCFAFIVLQMHCYYKCFVALPHGDMGWSAV